MTAPYRSFLLRLWLEPNNPPAWRAMLESTATGKRYGFNTIESLLFFLTQETNILEQELVSNQEEDQLNPKHLLDDTHCT